MQQGAACFAARVNGRGGDRQPASQAARSRFTHPRTAVGAIGVSSTPATGHPLAPAARSCAAAGQRTWCRHVSGASHSGTGTHARSAPESRLCAGNAHRAQSAACPRRANTAGTCAHTQSRQHGQTCTVGLRHARKRVRARVFMHGGAETDTLPLGAPHRRAHTSGMPHSAASSAAGSAAAC